MAKVEFSLTAIRDLDRLIRTHSLPGGTKARLARSVLPLARFPTIGHALGGTWDGFRFVLGPWRWMILVYAYLENENRVVIVTIQDGRSSRFAG